MARAINVIKLIMLEFKSDDISAVKPQTLPIIITNKTAN